MKKVYVNPIAEVQKFQIEDVITASGLLDVNAPEGEFPVSSEDVGIGANKVVQFNFSDL